MRSLWVESPTPVLPYAALIHDASKTRARDDTPGSVRRSGMSKPVCAPAGPNNWTRIPTTIHIPRGKRWI